MTDDMTNNRNLIKKPSGKKSVPYMKKKNQKIRDERYEDIKEQKEKSTHERIDDE